MSHMAMNCVIGHFFVALLLERTSVSNHLFHGASQMYGLQASHRSINKRGHRVLLNTCISGHTRPATPSRRHDRHGEDHQGSTLAHVARGQLPTRTIMRVHSPANAGLKMFTPVTSWHFLESAWQKAVCYTYVTHGPCSKSLLNDHKSNDTPLGTR